MVSVPAARTLGCVSDISKDFWESALSKRAALSADPNEDLAGFFKTLIEVHDGLQDWLTTYGLTMDQVVEWQSSARLQPTPHFGSDPKWVDGVKKMHYHGVPDHMISIILDVPLERIVSMKKMSGMSEHGPAVLELHRAGKSPYQISNALQIPKTTVWHIIERAGYTPKSMRNMIPAKTRHEIVELLRDGMSYADICTKLGVVDHQVSNVKRWAIKRNLLSSDRGIDDSPPT